VTVIGPSLILSDARFLVPGRHFRRWLNIPEIYRNLCEMIICFLELQKSFKPK